MNETKVGGHFPQPFQHAPAFQPTSPSNLFGNLARALETAGKKEDTDRFPTGRSKIDPESKPHLEFSQLSDFQNYLEKNSNSIFGIVEEASLVQSMGPISSPLALVTYSSGNIETDPPSLFNQASAELLEKMMRAIHLDYTQLYRTSMLKHNPGSKIWGRRELVPILNFLMSELGLVKSPFVLLLGESCAQAVLKTTKTMDEMRQIPFRGGNWEFVVSYHPDELLKREELKRKAWEDLQWLQRRMKQNQVQP